jgi:hypothetical protein
VISYIQISLAIVGLIQTPWPSDFQSFLQVFDFINFQFLPIGSVQCFTRFDYFDKLFLITSIPIGVLLVLGLVPLGILTILKDRNMDDSAAARLKLRESRRKIVRLFCFALFLMYPTTSSVIFSYFGCRSVNSNDLVTPALLRTFDWPER